MEAAAELAEHTGEPGEDNDHLGFGFGPTNVGLWSKALALEADEPDRAVSIAESVQPERHRSRPGSPRTGWTTGVRWRGCEVAEMILWWHCGGLRSSLAAVGVLADLVEAVPAQPADLLGPAAGQLEQVPGHPPVPPPPALEEVGPGTELVEDHLRQRPARLVGAGHRRQVVTSQREPLGQPLHRPALLV